MIGYGGLGLRGKGNSTSLTTGLGGAIWESGRRVLIQKKRPDILARALVIREP